MCGIVGYFDKVGAANQPIGKILLGMLDALACRGPDSAGVALFGFPRPNQLVARVKVGDNGSNTQRTLEVKTAAQKFGAQEFAQKGAYLRFTFRENDDLKIKVTQLQSKAIEADRLALLLNFHKSHESVPMLGARVIATSAGTASATIMLDRGSKDHIKKNMGVITPEGVVGKVVEVYDNTSEVLLLTDKDSGVGAMLGNSRVQSPVGGAGEPLLVMKYVANDDVVSVGERVVTSGMDKIFPRDLPIGTITDIKPGNPFKSIRIRPSAHLERLEEVIVLLTLQPLQLNQETETAKPSASVVSKPVAETAKSPVSGTAAKPAPAPVSSASVPTSTNAAAAVKPE